MLDHDQFKAPENGELKNIQIDTDEDFRFLSTDTVWPWDAPEASTLRSSTIWASIIGLSVAYGGVHLSAWNFEFPTAVESLLWKVSGILIPGIIFLAIFGIYFPANRFIGFSLNRFRQQGRLWVKCLDFLPQLPLRLSFLCRVYIVVEAYISLRAVPIGVYWTPEWIQMIPHV